MGKVFKKRDKTYPPKKDDTLASIVSNKCKEGITWQDLALFNWGTDKPTEVNRALVEIIGCSEIDSADPSKSKLDPAFGPEGGEKKIYIPELWKSEGLDVEKEHTIKVKKLAPAPAISITKLDKWFIPEIEKCEIKYALEGLKARADKVELEVYGSNYCESSDWNKGLGKFDKLHPDTPVYKEKLHDQTDERKEYGLPQEWKGKTNADKGLFKVKEDGKDRYVNVAFSPYTVNFRYYKAGDDKNARIILHPFWPLWEEEKTEPTVKTEVDGQIKIKWKNAADVDDGALEIFDKNEQRVYLEPLPKVKLKKNEQDITWNKRYLGHSGTRYRGYAVNSVFGKEYCPDTTLEPNFNNAGNLVGNIRIEWKVPAAGLKNGRLTVTDKNGNEVYAHNLAGGELNAGTRHRDWNGTYKAGTNNSAAGNKAIKADSPYRARIKGSNDAAGDMDLLGDGVYTFKVTTLKYKPKTDSLKVQWEVKKTDKNPLKRGVLEITDGRGKTVFRAALPEGKLGKDTQQEYEWKDGGKYLPGVKNSKDGDTAIPEDMPYRVQIQAHTDENKDPGLALASMHTEVRLYVSRLTHVPKHVAYDPWTNESSLELGLGLLVPGDTPEEGDVTKWHQYKLAEYGFHPGPVNGTKHDSYKIALKEFKRSVPEDGTVAAPNFKRLAIDENEDNKTKNAIKKIRGSDKRKWFGSLTRVLGNNDNPDLNDNQANTMLPNAEQDVIVWVDDRQYYTDKVLIGDPNPPPPTNDKDGNEVLVAPFNLDNHRANMNIGDDKVGKDAKSIARPWIPFKVHLQLVSREKGLYDELRALTEAEKEKTCKAVGPLRVDWTFDELPPDVSTIDPATVPNYDKDFVRSRAYVAWAIDQKKATHTRKDTKCKVRYTNCPKVHGGIRDNIADYYKVAFGHGDDESLLPWQAVPDSTTESVATVVHDHLMSDQKDQGTNLFKPLIGTAGVYFHPSNIAGDGYRVRAEVQFDKFGAYDLPNLKVLKARYPTPPQAHTARMRIWRKSSFRGHMCWGAAPTPTPNWGNVFINAFRTQYRAAHVYFVHEGGAGRQAFNINAIINEPLFKKIITKNVVLAALQDENKVTRNVNDVWPWTNENDFGWPSPIQIVPGITFDNCRNTVLNGTWRKFRTGLILALLKEVEKQGFLRGHLLVEFDSNSPCCFQVYRCNNAPGAHAFIYLEKNHAPGTRMDNQPCPAPGCGTAGKRLTHTGSHHNMNGLSLPAVGAPLGATWLFWRGENVNRLKAVWVHEVGHHRHLEHAANVAPAGAVDLHDSENNTWFNAWNTVKPPPGPVGTGAAKARHWDRRCIMSYADCWYGELGCLCGKCLLRNRGWKVKTLTGPGSRKADV